MCVTHTFYMRAPWEDYRHDFLFRFVSCPVAVLPKYFESFKSKTWSDSVFSYRHSKGN